MKQRDFAPFLTILIIVIMIAIGYFAYKNIDIQNQKATPTQSNFTSNPRVLPVTFPVQSADIVKYFNSIAQPDDLASIPYPLVQTLPEIKTRQTIVAFASWQTAERFIPDLSTQVKWLLYDPEHWSATPTTEQQNLPATIQNAAKASHAHNMRLMVAPDRRFVEEYLSNFAPYVDALLLQGQRLQNDPQSFSSWITEKIKIARTAHPKILIYVQVGANQGTPEQMLSAIQTVYGQIDGIAVWSNPGTLDSLKAFIGLLRPASPQIDH